MESGSEVIPAVPLGEDECAAFVLSQTRHSFSLYASKMKNGSLDPTSNHTKAILKACYIFLCQLEMIEVTPRLRDRAKLDATIKLAFTPQYQFPEDLATQAEKLWERWVDDDWGAVAAATQQESEQEEIEENQTAATTPQSQLQSSSTQARPLKLPPADHPIYGLGKIMDGVVFKRGKNGGIFYVQNPNAHDRARDHRVFGANGLVPGDWWPKQLAALFGGAHGSWKGGISGTMRAGARSVVIGNLYDELDSDRGDVVFYSGSGFLENREDKSSLPRRSAGTQALVTSMSTGRPVRLLRKQGGSRYAPETGVRYDGLYQVVAVDQVTHHRRGAYERFKLVRMAGQTPLDEVCRRSPTREQIALAKRVTDLY